MNKPYKLAVKAVLLDGQGRCLLLRRSRNNRTSAGSWEWPGGKVEPGEDFASAVVREVHEETALEIELTGVAGAAQCEMAEINVALLCMEAKVTAGEVMLSDEHDEYAWVSLAEFACFPLAEQIKNFMMDYAKCKQSSL